MTARRIGPGHVLVDGVRLAVLDTGAIDADLVFVLVHGWGSSSTAWAHVMPALAAAGRVIAVDLRGHGASERGEETVTIDRAVTDVRAVVAAAGVERPIIVGHSLGGTIATAYAIADPSIRGLVVIDPSYGADATEMAEAPARLTVYRTDGGLSAAQVIAAAFSTRADTALLIAAQHALLSSHPRALADLFESNYLAEGAVGAEAAAHVWLARRQTPTLAFYPSARRARLDLDAPEARVEIWDGAGHFMHQEQPERFAQTVLAWTDEHSKTAE